MWRRVNDEKSKDIAGDGLSMRKVDAGSTYISVVKEKKGSLFFSLVFGI